MRKIRGIEFPDGIADVVQKLVDRMEEKIGTSHLFSSKKHFGLKFALRLPDESKGKNKRHSACSCLSRRRRTEQ